MSERPPQANRTRRPRAALVIEGEAIVVSRRPSTHRAEAKAEPAPRYASAPHLDAAPQAIFGRRTVRRPPPRPDLVFQGSARPKPIRPTSEPVPFAPPRKGFSILVAAASFAGRSRDRRLAGAAGVLTLLALPLLAVSAPIGEAVATPGAAELVLEDLATSIVPRGTGAVLSVEGRIRNVSGISAAVPPLRIALAESDGGLRTKSLVTGIARLGAGRALRFHSTVAVAKDTKGHVEVGFSAAPGSSGKTLIE